METPALSEWWYRRSEQDLRAFTRVFWPVVVPGTPFLPNWHLDAICDHLMAVSLGHIRQLLINAPPREGKSTVVSVLWPAWEWIQWPAVQSLFVGHSESNLLRDSMLTRLVITSPQFCRRWGDRFELRPDVNTMHKFANDRGGARECVSMAGKPTGKGGDKLVADDPNDVSEANRANPDILDKAWETWTKTFGTRLNDAKLGQKVVLQQRVGDRDISGRMLEGRHSGVVCLILPTEYNPKRRCVTVGSVRPVPKGTAGAVRSPYGKRRESKVCDYVRRTFQDPRTREGQLLFPRRFGPAEVWEQKHGITGVGEWAFEGQYNQDPIPREGAIFARDKFKFYKRPPVNEKNRLAVDDWLQSWDMAFKDMKTNDYVVGGVMVRKGIDVYLVDVSRGRRSVSKSCDAVVELSEKWPYATRKLVEDKANGPAVVDLLKTKIVGLQLVEPKGGKEARANATEPIVNTGHLWLPDPNGCEWPDGHGGWVPHDTSWVDVFLKEVERFPVGSFDDQVDMLTQGVNWWIPMLKTLATPPRQIPTSGPSYWRVRS